MQLFSRSSNLQVCLIQADEEILKRQAQAMGLSMVEFVRVKLGLPVREPGRPSHEQRLSDCDAYEQIAISFGYSDIVDQCKADRDELNGIHARSTTDKAYASALKRYNKEVERYQKHYNRLLNKFSIPSNQLELRWSIGRYTNPLNPHLPPIPTSPEKEVIAALAKRGITEPVKPVYTPAQKA